MARIDAKAELLASANDFRALCQALGLLDDQYTDCGDYIMAICPHHDDRNPSLKVAWGDRGKVDFYCFACQKAWDIFSFVAQLNGLDCKTDFRTVLYETACVLGRADVAKAVRRGKLKVPPRSSTAQATQEPREDDRQKPYLNSSRLFEFLFYPCRETSRCKYVADYLRDRGLDPARVDELELARALPMQQECPRWARIKDIDWWAGCYQLLVPMCDHNAVDLNVRARRIVDGGLKTVVPKGYRVSGLVFANIDARRMFNPHLRHGALPPDKELMVIIAEGEIDFLTWATRPVPDHQVWAVIGVDSGSWTPEIAARIPDDTTVVIRTDHDDAGDRYAKKIIGTLGSRCRVLRSKG